MAGRLDYDQYWEHFADRLAEILRDNLREGQVEDAQTLARACARDEPDANDKVNNLLARIGLNMNNILDHAKGGKAKELVQEFVQRKPDAVTLIHQLLSGAGESIDGLTADAVAEHLDNIERIDRLTTIAESRRNVSLQEIDRRRVILGEKLRRGLQELEDGEFEAIETKPAKEENAA